MFDQTDPKWQKLVADITSGIKEWADHNPDATMADIERETMRRMAELQARMMEGILQAKAAGRVNALHVCMFSPARGLDAV
jgi:hypothetical protein